MKQIFIGFLSLILSTAPVSAAEKFAFREGDRVVLLGGTLIEREQRHGYWEAALTACQPGRDITFRNLGWSGDTVFAESRGVFDPPEKGFQRLVEGVKGLKPTVLLIAYGGNEAFDGKPGLPRFRQGMERLLDALAATKARVVLLSPLPMENLGPPLPDPAGQNRNLELYSDAVRGVADRRNAPFVDLFHLVKAASRDRPLTDNGLHLTQYGYWRTAPLLLEGLGLATHPWRIDIAADGTAQAKGGEVRKLQRENNRLTFEVKDTALPWPALPEGKRSHTLPGEERILQVRALNAGTYQLTVDGASVLRATAEQLAEGVRLKGPAFLQGQKLREAIVEKNRLYFHRWRPQNETYLFGFRKHEQGKNAREIPLFDPLVAEKEKAIARLRVPATQRYELVK